MYISYIVKEYIKRKKWRWDNKHNKTYLKKVLNPECIHVGIGTYGELNVEMSRKDVKLIIGNYCSLAADSKFILSSDHPTNYVSTFPFNAVLFNNNTDAISKGNIVVQDDVWIGSNAVILSGTTIGQGAVVAAGAIVTKDVPPYAVVGGVPAKVIGYRFDKERIKELLRLDYSKLTTAMVEKHIEELDQPYSENVDLSWFPHKMCKKDKDSNDTLK